MLCGRKGVCGCRAGDVCLSAMAMGLAHDVYEFFCWGVDLGVFGMGWDGLDRMLALLLFWELFISAVFTYWTIGLVGDVASIICHPL